MSELIADYQPRNGYFDEACVGPGRFRPHWEQFARQFGDLGGSEINRRWEQAQRQLRELGVTYNPQDDTGQASRPWELDAIPYLMPAAEWRMLATAIEQRALLFDLILADLFGDQSLIRDRVVPPDLWFAHPRFQPAYQGLPASQGARLVLYAADLARSPDGGWRVAGDRTRAPNGLGYVLENRIVTSRMLPNLFRNGNVVRLAQFFLTLRETLKQLAPRSRDNPRVVVWSEGSASAGFFEDAYLSRYLNYVLAESGDLAVRNNRVMLKTLGGLRPIEVLLRRVDDEQCDSVELAPNAKHGVAGLVESVRSGNVALANPLGSRLMESPAWLPFLPAICRRLLSEELLLPSVATWWCGQDQARRYVMEHLNELVVRPAFRVGSGSAVLPRDLSKERRDELRAAIQREPEKYVAQQQTPRSTAPAWTGAGVEPWHLDLRMFAVGLHRKFSVMPGGLARASANADELEYVIRAGQRSHDVWVLGEEPTAKVSLLTPQGKPVVLKRSGSELPSRVADNLFWLGRHVERADGAGRLLRTVFRRLASDEENDPAEFTALLRLLAEQGQVEPAFIVDGMQQSLPQIEVALPASVFNEQEPTSLRSTVNQIVHLSTVVRDRLSLDVWRIVLQINEHCRKPSVDQDKIDATDVLEVIERLIADLSAIAGLVADRMTRTLGWRFLELGRRIEAALLVAGLLRGTICRRHGDEQRILESVLTIDDSVMTYRSRYLADLRAEPVVDLLLIDETNPRSIGYQLAAIENHVEQLPRDERRVAMSPEARLALSMLNRVRLADVYELCQIDSDGARPLLDRLLARLTDQLPRLSDAISSRFLIHAGLPRHFGSVRGAGR